MKRNEVTVLVALMQATPWRGKWTEDQEDFWFRELVSYDANTARTAVEHLAGEVDYIPTIREFRETYGMLAEQQRRRAEEHRALPAGERRKRDEVGARYIAVMRKLLPRMKDRADSSVTMTALGHDHRDKRPFGWTLLHQRGSKASKLGVVTEVVDDVPVPAWWFTCPRCGTGDAQDSIGRWSDAGLDWMHTNGYGRPTTTNAEMF